MTNSPKVSPVGPFDGSGVTPKWTQQGDRPLRGNSLTSLAHGCNFEIADLDLGDARRRIAAEPVERDVERYATDFQQLLAAELDLRLAPHNDRECHASQSTE